MPTSYTICRSIVILISGIILWRMRDKTQKSIKQNRKELYETKRKVKDIITIIVHEKNHLT